MLLCEFIVGNPSQLEVNSPVEELLWRILGIRQVVRGALPNIGLTLSYKGGVYSR